MRRKWTAKVKKQLINGAAKFAGKKSEYFKKVGVSPSQYYNFKRELIGNRHSAHSVVQIMGASTGSQTELVFPSGHRLRFTSQNIDAVLDAVFQRLGGLR